MSYGTKLPPPLLAPASFSLRGAGILVATAFVFSMLFMVAVMQSVGVEGIAPHRLRSLTTLRRTADEMDATVPMQVLQQLKLQLSDDSSVRVDVTFDADHPVTPGQFVPMKEAQEAPSVVVKSSVDVGSELYTYVLMDIDAPDPKAPTHAPFLHYILAGLTGDEQSEQPQQQVVVPYYPVSPPTGEHRYVSLLFHQQGSEPDGLDDDLTAKRSNFDVAGFATKHKLELIATSSFHSHPAKEDD